MEVRSDHIIAEGVGGIQRVTVRDASILRRVRGGRTLVDAFAGIEVIVAPEISDEPPPGFERYFFSSKLKPVQP